MIAFSAARRSLSGPVAIFATFESVVLSNTPVSKNSRHCSRATAGAARRCRSMISWTIRALPAFIEDGRRSQRLTAFGVLIARCFVIASVIVATSDQASIIGSLTR
jgi:hypothetical protein